MNDKIIELKNRYVPAKSALHHLVHCARKGGGTAAGAQKELWDFLECAAALTSQLLESVPPAVFDIEAALNRIYSYSNMRDKDDDPTSRQSRAVSYELRAAYAAGAQSQKIQDALDAARRLKALRAAQRGIDSMKQTAETAGAGGDKRMLKEACESISNEGLSAFTAINEAIALEAHEKWLQT